jgi:hypothetical protein
MGGSDGARARSTNPIGTIQYARSESNRHDLISPIQHTQANGHWPFIDQSMAINRLGNAINNRKRRTNCLKGKSIAHEITLLPLIFDLGSTRRVHAQV